MKSSRLDRAVLTVATILGAGLLIVLIALLFLIFMRDRWELMGVFLGLLRFIMALCAALLSWFILGRIVLKGTLWGTQVGAAGGFVLFVVIMFLVDPFGGQRPPGPKKWDGGNRLGSLVETIWEKRSSGETDERIDVAAERKDEILGFRPAARTFVGRTWVDLVARICDAHGCLQCRKGGSASSIMIEAAKPLKRCSRTDGTAYYVCPDEAC